MKCTFSKLDREKEINVLCGSVICRVCKDYITQNQTLKTNPANLLSKQIVHSDINKSYRYEKNFWFWKNLKLYAARLCHDVTYGIFLNVVSKPKQKLAILFENIQI
jgi:hypothetical protein